MTIQIGNVEHKFVSTDKFNRMTDLIEGMLSGQVKSKHALVEHLTTGDDSIFALAAVTNAQVLELYEDPAEERQWTKIAQTRVVDDFETPKFYTIKPETSGNSRPAKGAKSENPADVLPVVPEGSPYPRFSFKGELYAPGRGLHKRGGVFSLTWEDLLSDPENIIAAMPGLITESFLEAEEFEIFDALRAATKTAGTGLVAGTTYDGRTVAKNAPLSQEALVLAMEQLSTRELDGRPINFRGQFKLIVPIGVADQVNWIINGLTRTTQLDSTTGITSIIDTSFDGFSRIAEVVETEYLTGTEWILIPTPGSTKRPALELLKLRGHETPDIRLQNVNGQYAGGGQVGPFEGSFETDDAAIRGRLPLAGLHWTPAFVLHSDGTGQ